MAYTLIGSHTSPYARKIRLLLAAKEIPYHFKAINYLEKNDSDYLKSVSPINQIPILLDGTDKIFDSRVIYNYLGKKHHWSPLSLHEENILSAIDAAMDTSINLFSFQRGGLNLNIQGNYFVDRQKERPSLVLNELKTWIQSLDPQQKNHWNFLSMSLYAYLFWGQYREILDLSSHPEAKEFLEKFKDCPGVRDTDIPV